MADEHRAARHVVVSGASSGIGLATALRFLANGDKVVNLDLVPAPDGEEAGFWVECDVSDWGALSSALDRAEEQHGPADVVIANAGISIRHTLAELTEEESRRVMDVNFFGVLGLWQEAARRMVARDGGVLLATASTNGIAGYPYYADYNASKAAVLSLCKSFALEYAPVVRVATVSPGYVMTPMQRKEYTDAMIDQVNAKIPLRRHAAVEEIAEAFFYLSSPKASFFTGQTLVLDGGELSGGTASGHGLKFGVLDAEADAASTDRGITDEH